MPPVPRDHGRPNGDRVGLARHGRPAPRGQVALPGARGSRFGRMFGQLAEADIGCRALARLITLVMRQAGTSTENYRIPAGYTYFGQFVDHDVTFDPTSSLQRHNDPNALVDFRTPRLDLDSLYGSGPIDQPFLYDWKWRYHRGVKLLVGRDRPDRTVAAEDLPRNEDGRALTGDARNDENLIIAQLHLLFIRFHNRVVDWLLEEQPAIGSRRLFEEAQRTVRWHYQWIVIHDFLPRIVGNRYEARFGSRDAGPLLHERRFFTWRERPFMPVEFSGAAYRFGHSMVREDYAINDGQPNVPIMHPNAPGGDDLHGFRHLPDRLRIEWKHFFRTARGTPPQKGMRIDPSLARALDELRPDDASLAALNLRRGRALGLPAGRDVARVMGLEPLSDDQLLKPLEARLDEKTADAILRATPLWYYVLAEARARGGGGLRLGPVGGRIVAEVLHGLVEGDPQSYLRQWPDWTPELPASPQGSFTMADLVRFAQSRPQVPPRG